MKRIMILLLVTSISFMSACNGPKYIVLTDLEKYIDYIDAVTFNDDCDFFPNINELPDTASIDLKYIERTAFSARSKNLALVITLSEDQYHLYKEKILSEYDFLNEPIIDDDKWVRISEVEFEYLSYSIMVVNNNEFYYPMNFGMIGYSDENKQIIFLMYFDSDRDGITDMIRFVQNEFLLEERT